MQPLNVEVLPTVWNRVELTFDQSIAVKRLDETLYQELDRIPGVEEVQIKRYSAFVLIAGHVVAPQVVARQIADEFIHETVLSETIGRVYAPINVTLLRLDG